MFLIVGDAKRPGIKGKPVPFLASPTLTKDAVSTGLAAQLGWKIGIGEGPTAVETGWTLITSVPSGPETGEGCWPPNNVKFTTMNTDLPWPDDYVATAISADFRSRATRSHYRRQ